MNNHALINPSNKGKVSHIHVAQALFYEKRTPLDSREWGEERLSNRNKLATNNPRTINSFQHHFTQSMQALSEK
jgi:hypothetical protein